MLGNSGRWLCAAAMAVAATVTGTGSAAADTAREGKDLVVLGDSFSANVWNPLSEVGSCERGATAWPERLSTLMGVAGTDRVENRSCLGASIDTSGYTLGVETRDADKAGAFGPRTKVVTLQFGLNDRWGTADQSLWAAMQHCVFDLAEGCGADAVAAGRLPDARDITGTSYAARIRNAVTYIRYYAPNARIVLVGYPELFHSEQDTVCLDFFGVVPFTQPRGRTVVEYFNRIDQAQREAAQELKIDFLDARAITSGHGLCSPQPWVNGVLDPTVNIEGLPFHPSPVGDDVVGKAIFDRYAR
ncbi:SGNH/GDSL hydrolase family protein [Nocardia sp. NPDC052001]|uniref:SGNH/GDSL hydrolase family protein n=1 Tax=Nocardia sp. NPDC052001 TaxID=3154853 RepID=UPI003447A780